MALSVRVSEKGQVVNALGPASDVIAVTAHTKARNESAGELSNVTAWVFANQRTGEFAEFFVRQGYI